MNNAEKALLYFANCAIHQTIPSEPEDVDYQALYQLSAFHSVAAMIAMALESGGLLTESCMTPELIQHWTDAKNKSMRKNLLLDAQRREILDLFEKNGVWYLPLKGSILKDLYPRLGMRQMADNDILFDANYRSFLKEEMLKLGYTPVSVGKSHHDEYQKPPVYNFEFHTALYGAAHDPDWVRYYENVRDRLIKDPHNNWGYHFTDEDFYIYITSHTYKHYNGSGTGIRSLIDCYLYVNKKGEALNWDYIRGELAKLGIREFEEQSRTLAEKVFAPQTQLLTDSEGEMLSYFLRCGTFGTTGNRVTKMLSDLQNDGKPITKWTKFRFWMHHLFPGLDYMKKHVPFCYKHRWSIPFFWIYRLFWALKHRKGTIRQEIKTIRDAK